MKVLFLLLLMGIAWADDLLDRRGGLVPPPQIYDLEELNKVLFSETKLQNEEIRKVKYYLINGEIRLAKVYLSKLVYSQTSMRPVIYRYLGLLAFIEGKFEESLRYLSLPELQRIPYYSKICTLKVLNQIVLEKTSKLEAEWYKCQVENPKNFNDDRLVWLETLIQMKVNPRPGITKTPFKAAKLTVLNNEELKILLKLSIYLNQEKLIVEQLKELNLDQLQDPEVRELVGHIYFRNGSFVLANRFIEDSTTPNAENMKGNLYLLRNKYELAYAQFKLALEQKQNSQNAMERLLPLAWILKDWQAGSEYSERVIASPQTQINKLTLVAAFQMQKGDFENARKILENIQDHSHRANEIDVTQLQSYVALMQNKPQQAQKYAKLSCEQYDMVNCWVQFQLVQWDAFPLTLQRKEKVYEKKEWEKLLKDDLNQPLTETVYVNQLDIEEMDDKLIQLVPKAP